MGSKANRLVQGLYPGLSILKSEKALGMRLSNSTVHIDRFQSRGKQLCKCLGTNESVYIRKELKSHTIGLVHQHGRLFIVLVH